MGNIQKQSITASVITYVGFAVGALNTWIFTSGFFTAEQYGLTRIMYDIGYTLFALANLGSVSVMYRFYPYYRDRLPLQKRDLFGKMFLVSMFGFLLVSAMLLLFKDLFIQKFSGNSPLLVQYYYVLFPFTFFFLIYSLLEVQAWNHYASVVTAFYKEFVLRVLTTLLILLFLLNILDFDHFIVLFSLLFGCISLGLFLYLRRKHAIVFTLKTSQITTRMKDKMVPYGLFISLVSFCGILAKTFDTILISSVLDLSYVGIFTFITYLTSIMEAPQRGLIAASLPVIAQSWKNKDRGRIFRIYQKTSINMLLFSGFIFALVWMNLHNAFAIFHLDTIYLRGETALLILGVTKILELGTGVNSQIILTSRYWRVDFVTTVILLVTLIPLNYLLVRKYGITGTAWATFIAYLLFNSIRFGFIWVKFKMQPFTFQTLIAIVILIINYFIVTAIIQVASPLLEAILQTALYTILSAFLIIRLKVSEDANNVFNAGVRRIKEFVARSR
ncbi:lipopolysaccharide biosynthesis protein [Chitinophaga cymbidii]|uniref:Polysaccharide biosynthesis protein C-terminal domain-containing protein n=1 Tax=Chitinophaga cymbidii TaxID=1096750 RepID=A0A512RNL0_9BACT|nr:hypothetical protein [Chitinophaga cymbidii]GEP97296.1 hypothetical protein CCY01nite_35560 [Chitinophaga cymbidii]